MSAADTLVRLLQALEAYCPDKVRAEVDKLSKGFRDDPEVETLPEKVLIERGEAALRMAAGREDHWIKLLLNRARDIDAWYAPLNPGSPRAGKISRNLLNLIAEGRLNEDRTLGAVVPKGCRWGRTVGDSDENQAVWRAKCCRSPSLANSLLHYLVWLPRWLPADHWDGVEDQKRRVKVNFRQFESEQPIPDGELKIGFAPLAERDTDVGLNLPPQRKGRRWYDIQLADLGARMVATLDKMRADGVHVAIFPETTVTPENLVLLKDYLRRQRGDNPIRLVVAGILTPSNRVFSRNRLVVLNGRGHQLHEHKKLMRWNLNGRQRSWYDFAPGMDPAEDLYENICPGRQVDVLEIPGLGRLMTLICADMNAGEPWNWIRRNLPLDWTFAPILDSSMGIDRWIGRAGERASRVARSRVVVTNSVAMQAIYGRVTGPPTPTSCAALLMDGRESRIIYSEYQMALGGPSDMTGSTCWECHGWTEAKIPPECKDCPNFTATPPPLWRPAS